MWLFEQSYLFIALTLIYSQGEVSSYSNKHTVCIWCHLGVTFPLLHIANIPCSSPCSRIRPAQHQSSDRHGCNAVLKYIKLYKLEKSSQYRTVENLSLKALVKRCIVVQQQTIMIMYPDICCGRISSHLDMIMF